MKKAVFNWSGGKDSSLCLYHVMQEKHYNITTLLTTVNAQHQRIAMHGVRVELLQQQAGQTGIPLTQMLMPEMPTMEAYDDAMRKTLTRLKEEGTQAAIYGDIFLEDLRAYREAKLSEVSLEPVFPLWKIPTTKLMHEFIDLGFKAVLVCVNEKYLDKSFAGRVIDKEFLNDLPAGVDPCGENGEYHTFVFDGPVFQQPIPFTTGEVVYRKYDSLNENEESPYRYGFWFTDLLPV